MALTVILSNTAGTPIYEQIADQVREAVLTGAVHEGELLPSIRRLARDLRVSVITTTRAYQELVGQGLVSNVPGKGYFVAPRDWSLVEEQVLREIEDALGDAVTKARLLDIDRAELHTMLDTLIDTPEEP